jgi:hypothetical protein
MLTTRMFEFVFVTVFLCVTSVCTIRPDDGWTQQIVLKFASGRYRTFSVPTTSSVVLRELGP